MRRHHTANARTCLRLNSISACRDLGSKCAFPMGVNVIIDESDVPSPHRPARRYLKESVKKQRE